MGQKDDFGRLYILGVASKKGWATFHKSRAPLKSKTNSAVNNLYIITLAAYTIAATHVLQKLIAKDIKKAENNTIERK